MLTTLEVTNKNILSEGVAFDPNGSAATDMLQIRNISGLDPVQATTGYTPYASVDGEILNGITIGKRNIVLTFGLNADPFKGFSISDLLEIIYKYFMPKTEVTLTFLRYAMPTVEITGNVENIESNHFSADPEVTVSILCADPYFKSQKKQTVQGKVLQATDDLVGKYTPIVYSGNIPVGFELFIDARMVNLTDSWHIKTLAPQAQDFWIWGHQLVTTDDILFSSIVKNRYVKTAQGISLLSKVPYGSDWTLLQPGPNLFAVAAETVSFSAANAPEWTMTYNESYGGI